MAKVEHLLAALPLSNEGGDIATEFVYLPEGTHEIQASVNGKAATRSVTVGPDSLAPLVEALAARHARNVRPFGGFDHKEGGPASFIPKGFSYRPGKGVMLEVEWTEAGMNAVKGRNYSYFSPSFFRDKATGSPIGLPLHGEIGSLVNEPAFESIERIAASHQTESDMEAIEELKAALVKAEIVTEEQAKDTAKLAETIKANLTSATETAVSAAVAEATKDAPEQSELEKEITRLKAENQTLTETLSAKRAAEADEAIAEAVKAGRIPAQDEETKAFWKEAILSGDGVKAKAQLAKLPGSEALKAGRVVDTSKGGEQVTGLARAIAAHKASSGN